MSKFKKIIVILLTICLGMTTFVSCKKKPTQNPEDNQPVDEEKVMEYTENSLVENGTSAYKIVLPQDTLYNERLARDELVDFFYQATGITLAAVKDSDVTYSDDANLIILGDTAFTSHSGENVSEFPTQGFKLKTVGSNLFILGEDYGVLYGVYEFLTWQLGYEIYAPDEIALDKNVTNLKLIKFDFSDSPDIWYREPNYGTLNDVVAGNRFRMHNNLWLKQNGNFVHNAIQEYFDKNKYLKAHPEYYSNDETQLCYTGHGSEDTMKEMQDIVFNRMTEIVNYYYSRGDFLESISFTQEDTGTWCDCEACKQMAETYSANSASLIKFVNPVAKRMKEWMANTWPGHQLYIAVFAYQRSEAAPVQNVNNEYIPARRLSDDEKAQVSGGKFNGQDVYELSSGTWVKDDSLYYEDNVALFYAPISGNFMYPLENAKNSSFKETLDKWTVLVKNTYLWFYTTNFSDYLAWYDSYNSMQPLYRFAKRYNARYFFDQGRYSTTALTAFDSLKVYLNCKLAWNVDSDLPSLIDAFFENYFKDAAGPMREYFESFRSWSQYIKENTTISGQCGAQLNNQDYWPKQILVEWQGYVKKAYEALEPLKATDAVMYDKLYTRIEKEEIAIRFHLYDLHANTYDAATLQALRRQFKADATRLGFVQFSELESLADAIYTKWGF